MDELTLVTLKEELKADCQVADQAWQMAQARFGEKAPSAIEGCAHHLARLYNIIEQMAKRVARSFDNHVDEDGGWHAELIRRLSIPVQGVRPAFFLEEMRQPLRELRAFRHVLTHAYDLELDRDKLALLLKYAGQVTPRLAQCALEFVRQVAQQEGLDIS